MTSRLLKTLIATGLLTFGAVTAQAGPILCATDATINSGGPGFGTLTETFDQSGLDTGYTCGVTDFDTYIATGPGHTTNFGGFEWFSTQGLTSASVTYNLGAVVVLEAIALWNEESAGIGVLDLFGSTDGIVFTSILTGLLPTDHAAGTGPNYLADVFTFTSTALQYVRFDMFRCPQADSSFDACAIGEVAFSESTRVSVPEPGTLALFGFGLFGIGLAARRKKIEV